MTMNTSNLCNDLIYLKHELLDTSLMPQASLLMLA